MADQKKSECGKRKHQIMFHCLALGLSGDDLLGLLLLFGGATAGILHSKCVQAGASSVRHSHGTVSAVGLQNRGISPCHPLSNITISVQQADLSLSLMRMGDERCGERRGGGGATAMFLGGSAG